MNNEWKDEWIGEWKEGWKDELINEWLIGIRSRDRNDINPKLNKLTILQSLGRDSTMNSTHIIYTQINYKYIVIRQRAR